MSEQVKFHLEITMPKRWTPQFIEMLDCVRWCAEHGASRTVAFYADGDGDFRPFDFRVADFDIERLDWRKHDGEWSLDKAVRYAPQESPPPYKTWRGIDFFFDAG